MKLLLVEDDQALHGSLVKLLKKAKIVVDGAFDGLEAQIFLENGSYDLMILDVMMPEMNGFELLDKIRRDGNDLPVIFLTAKDSLEDRIGGLDLGADDYMVKPFEFDELLARIHAVLRRHEKTSISRVFHFKDILLDLDKKRLYKLEEEIELTGKELQLLEYLIKNQGQILSREQIRDQLWSQDYLGSSNMIDVLVKNIRKKTGQADLIQTKRGVGYYVQED